MTSVQREKGERMDEVILSRIRQEAYEQGYQDGKIDGYNLAGALMSSAKQERKRGKWIKGKKSLWSVGKCSVCGAISVEADTANYCPNCGTQMDGGKAEYGDGKIYCGSEMKEEDDD